MESAVNRDTVSVKKPAEADARPSPMSFSRKILGPHTEFTGGNKNVTPPHAVVVKLNATELPRLFWLRPVLSKATALKKPDDDCEAV